MQEKIESQTQNTINTLFNLQLLTIEEQKRRLKCHKNNQALFFCISQSCQKPSGILCIDLKCQCWKSHEQCHHILLSKILKKIQKHQKQISKEGKQFYQTIYTLINQMIEKLSNIRTKFQLQQKYFGLKQPQINFLEYIYDEKIQMINGKKINFLQKELQLDRQSEVMKKQDLIKSFQQKTSLFDKLCSYIEKQYLRSNKKLQVNRQLFSNSKILNIQQSTLLIKWVKQIKPNTQLIKSQLLYRASQNQFKASQFHNKCTYKKNTIVIVKNQYDKIYGGFTPQEWLKNQKGIPIKDTKGQSFLFSLNMKEKYKCVKPQLSTFSYIGCGPIFGSQKHDLVIKDQCDKGSNNYGYFPSCFNKSQNQLKKSQQLTKQFYGHEQRFNIKQYEVYQLFWKQN